MKYIPKVFLTFELPDGSTEEGLFRQSQGLGSIIGSFGVKGKAFLIVSFGVGGRARRKALDQNRAIGQLGLKNNDVIGVR